MTASLRRRVERLEAAFAERGGGIDWKAERAAYGPLLWHCGRHRAYGEQQGQTGVLMVLGDREPLRCEVDGVRLEALR